MGLDNRLRQTKPQAVTVRGTAGIDAEEAVEDTQLMIRRDAEPRVLNTDGDLRLPYGPSAKCLCSIGRVIDRI